MTTFTSAAATARFQDATEADSMIVYVVQDSIFGDYGNGEIYGVYTDKEEAKRVAEAKGKHCTDVTAVPLTSHDGNSRGPAGPTRQ